MWIQSLDVTGLCDLPQCTLVDVPREGMTFHKASPETTALADAIELWFAAFHQDAIVDWVVGMGWAYEEEVEVFGEQHIEEVLWVDGTLPQLWLEDRDVSIRLTLGLDISTIQDLRTFVSAPDLVVALMDEKTLSATVTLRFTNDYRVMAVGIHALQLGSIRFPSEKPVWIPKLYALLHHRFVRSDDRISISESALQALLSLDGFERYEAFQEACASLGQVRVVGGRDRAPFMLVDNLPLRRWGTSTLNRLRILAAMHLLPADIVWCENLDSSQTDHRQIWGIDPSSENDGHRLNDAMMDAPIQFKP